jgi:hypothetical protein
MRQFASTVMQGNLQQDRYSVELFAALDRPRLRDGSKAGALLPFDERRDGKRKQLEESLFKRGGGS